MKEASDKMIRLEIVKIVAQLMSPNDARGNLLIRADEIYKYVRTGARLEIELRAERR